ncbi:hypothetical protein D9M70_516600 [compost metagenome]
MVLFAHRDYRDMEQEDRIRACYQHCCLKYVNREPMNNTSLRERFHIDEGNSAMVSRIIKQTIEAGLIRLYDPKANRKAYRYVPKLGLNSFDGHLPEWTVASGQAWEQRDFSRPRSRRSFAGHLTEAANTAWENHKTP